MADVITQERLTELFDYNKTTGHFTYKKSTAACVRVGQRAGYCRSNAYRYIKIDYKHYPEHKLAFMIMGVPVPYEIDHINAIKSDNRWENLRGCTKSQNEHNKSLTKNNTSGIKGLSYQAKEGMWRATIKLNSKPYYKLIKAPRDCEETKKLLELWLITTREQLHGEFANHG